MAVITSAADSPATRASLLSTTRDGMPASSWVGLTSTLPRKPAAARGVADNHAGRAETGLHESRRKELQPSAVRRRDAWAARALEDAHHFSRRLGADRTQERTQR